MITQFEQANDQVDSQASYANSPERNDQQALIGRLTSEVDYLWGQLDKQTQFLAASTPQNSKMVARLNPSPRPSWVKTVRQRFFTKIAKCESEA